jgi:heme oxygenase (biliverdin-producing, ferredoxin)
LHLLSALEAALDKHAGQPSLAPTYNARLLSRSEALSSDISSLLQTSSEPSVWQTHPLYQSFLPLPTAVSNYVARINEISDSSDPTPLVAHSYVRYLGDLSGGQFIKRIVTKAYGLDESAVNFYEFGKLGGSGPTGANIGDMRKVKDWFREGIDTGVPGDDFAKGESPP